MSFCTKKIINNYPIICNNHHVERSKFIIDCIIDLLKRYGKNDIRLSISSISINCEDMCCPKLTLTIINDVECVIISDGLIEHILDYSMRVKTLERLLENVRERIYLD